jgi:hypothetical protein
MIALKEDEAELVRLIAELASEVELQAKTLKSLKTLREELSDLEKYGIVRRRSGTFKGGFGDAVELTPDGL